MKQSLKFLRHLLVVSGLACAGHALAEPVEVYAIDNTHSFANFTIRHVVSKTAGSFPDVKGKIVINRGDLSQSTVMARINVLSA